MVIWYEGFNSTQSMQNGPRGRREREFYEKVRTELRTEKSARLRAAAQTAVSEDISDEDDQASVSGRSDDDADTQAKLPFSVRNAAMLATVPRFCKFWQLNHLLTHAFFYHAITHKHVNPMLGNQQM